MFCSSLKCGKLYSTREGEKGKQERFSDSQTKRDSLFMKVPEFSTFWQVVVVLGTHSRIIYQVRSVVQLNLTSIVSTWISASHTQINGLNFRGKSFLTMTAQPRSGFQENLLAVANLLELYCFSTTCMFCIILQVSNTPSIQNVV